jgi:hypothetical protein
VARRWKPRDRNASASATALAFAAAVRCVARPGASALCEHADRPSHPVAACPRHSGDDREAVNVKAAVSQSADPPVSPCACTSQRELPLFVPQEPYHGGVVGAGLGFRSPSNRGWSAAEWPPPLRACAPPRRSSNRVGSAVRLRPPKWVSVGSTRINNEANIAHFLMNTCRFI